MKEGGTGEYMTMGGKKGKAEGPTEDSSLSRTYANPIYDRDGEAEY